MPRHLQGVRAVSFLDELTKLREARLRHESEVDRQQRLACLAWVAKRQWLTAAHEARMRGRTIHFINATDRSPIPLQRELL